MFLTAFPIIYGYCCLEFLEDSQILFRQVCKALCRRLLRSFPDPFTIRICSWILFVRSCFPTYIRLCALA